MGSIVGAAFSPHIPRLNLTPEELEAYTGSRESSLRTGLHALREEIINKLDFDTFLIFDTHWHSLMHFLINAQEHHTGLYTSDEVPHMIHEYEYDFRGDSDLSDLIEEEGEKAGLRVMAARYHNMPCHYPVLMTMKYLDPKNRHRVVPMSITFTSSIENELTYGAAIQQAISRSDRKVVLVATGGLSHKFWEYDLLLKRASADPSDISSPENRAQDAWLIEKLKAGKHADILAQTENLRATISPEGRFAHYLRMMGALGQNDCTIKGIQYGNYEAAAGTGQAIFWFPVENN